jgi:hypothetical protein
MAGNANEAQRENIIHKTCPRDITAIVKTAIAICLLKE